eukprot:950069_1
MHQETETVKMMQTAAKTDSMPVMYPGPVVNHYPSEDAFTVSNVRSMADFEVIAPSMEFNIIDVGSVGYRVEYMPTSKHLVKLNIAGGGEIARFMVSKTDGANLTDAGPEFLEITPEGPERPRR